MRGAIRFTVLAISVIIATKTSAAEMSAAISTGDAWAAQALQAIHPITDADVAQQRQAVEKSLAALRDLLRNAPSQQILERDWNLAALDAQLSAVPPDANVLRGLEGDLYERRSGKIQKAINVLRADVALYAAHIAAANNPQHVEQARAHVQTIAAYLRASVTDKNADAEPAREAFVALASQHIADKPLRSVRPRLSHPNQRVMVRAEYLKSVGGRRFSIPVNVNDRWNGTDVQAQGQVNNRTQLGLEKNPQRAELTVVLNGDGKLDLDANRKRANVDAIANQLIDAQQTFYLDSQGVSADALQLNITNRTMLQNVYVDMRTRLGSCFASRLAERFITSRLADGDAQAAAAVESRISERVEDEGYDIAYRINGLFRRVYWDRLTARDVDPHLQLESTPAGLIWNAEYARADQLGAPIAPPSAFPDTPYPLDVCNWLHESAFNNSATALSGKPFDEATFHAMFEEDFKLQRDASELLPRARVPAVLRFAADPLEIHFDDMNVSITARVNGFAYNGQWQEIPEHVIHVRYQLTVGSAGIELQRDKELDIQPPVQADLPLVEVLQRFLPEKAHSLHRFQNDSFRQRLRVSHFALDNGWLTVGSSRTPVKPQVSATPVKDKTP